MFIKTLLHQKKKLFFLLLFLFLAVPLWLFEAPAASAHPASGGPVALQRSHLQKTLLHGNVLCSGSGCNHLDPYTTRCAASMYTVTTAYLKTGSLTGRVELEYSTVCQTNWDQIYRGNGVEFLSGCVIRNPGPDGPSDWGCSSS